MTMFTMESQVLAGKRVLIRADLNVPIQSGQIGSDARLRAVLPTLKLALQSGAGVLLMSHLGRPKEGRWEPQFSLAPIAAWFSAELQQEVVLAREYLGGIPVRPGEVKLLENVRFNAGESKNELGLAKQYAALCDLFVMEAFGAAHRAHASTAGICQYAPKACAGPLLLTELSAIRRALQAPQRPMVAIIGGSKVSTKLDILGHLAGLADQIIVGGGLANTFFAAQGWPVGDSLYEPELLPKALQILAQVPIQPMADVCVGGPNAARGAQVKPLSAIGPTDKILDFGERSMDAIEAILKPAKTILWNGPIGMFEQPQFRQGTQRLARIIAESGAFSLVGGGDTLAALSLYGLTQQMSYVSTGGGAFLACVSGLSLPAVQALEKHAANAA